MNKTMKIISTLVIALVLVTVLSQGVFATDDYGPVINGLEGGTAATGTPQITSKAKTLLATIRNISAIIAVFVIVFLGIKYMMGSVEEKAGYKKSFIPLIVGTILVVAATTIATFLFSLGAV